MKGTPVLVVGSLAAFAFGPPRRPLDVRVTNDQRAPVPVTVQDGSQAVLTEYRVVAFTTTRTRGLIQHGSLLGHAAMHKLCADEVSPDARAAFSEEALRTPTFSPPLDGPAGAWVIPSSLVPIYLPDSTDDTRDWAALDPASGVVGGLSPDPVGSLRAASCVSFSASVAAANGTAWHALLGAIVSEPCSTELPIACSEPLALPVAQ